jgi:hypothetical protein
MTSDVISYSMDDISRIIQGITKHSLENPCPHSLDQILQEIFET